MSGTTLLNLQDNSDFQISTPYYPTQCNPSGNDDVLDVVVNRNVHLSDVNV